MKRTQQILMALFWAQLLIPALLYVGGEFLDVDMAFLSDCPSNVRYVVSTVMILLSLTLIPLALRLFKFRKIHDDLIARQAFALDKWGRARLIILGDLLLFNTALYYAFGFEPTFGYLAVVTLLTLPFVYPTMNRCLTETEDEQEEGSEA